MNDRVLVVEDEPIVRGLIVEVLGDAGFDVVATDRGESAFELVAAECPSLVVSDIVMPGLSGLELLERLRAERPSLPIVLVTGAGTYGNVTQALASGASGIVVKPFGHADLVKAVRDALRRARATEEEVRHRVVMPTLAAALANAIEARDVDTHGHCERLSALATRIADRVGLAAAEREVVRLGAILHDIGKVGIPDRVLLKPRPLSGEELALIETHPAIGDRLLAPLDLLPGVRAAVRHHHERWDGAGYPDRLAGEDIPLAARIVAVADAVEAMSARRPYRAPLRPAAIVRKLTQGRGAQWDPVPVDIALDLIRSGELAFGPGGARVGEPIADETFDGLLSVLLVEDDDDEAAVVGDVIRRALGDVRIVHAPSVASAERFFTDWTWSLAVVDHDLPDGTGLDLLERLRGTDPGVPVLMMTGAGSERLAVEAFRRGASDYVVKGADSLQELESRVQSLIAA